MPGLREIKSVENFSRGEHCFNSVSLPLGVYPVERGEVRILLSTGQKQRQLLEAVVSGVVLGFGESLTGKNHRITAEAWDKTSLAFIPRETFHEIPRGRGDVCMEILQLLGDDLHGLYRKFPSISAHPGGPRHRPFDEQLNESARFSVLNTPSRQPQTQISCHRTHRLRQHVSCGFGTTERLGTENRGLP